MKTILVKTSTIESEEPYWDRTLVSLYADDEAVHEFEYNYPKYYGMAEYFIWQNREYILYSPRYTEIAFFDIEKGKTVLTCDMGTLIDSESKFAPGQWCPLVADIPILPDGTGIGLGAVSGLWWGNDFYGTSDDGFLLDLRDLPEKISIVPDSRFPAKPRTKPLLEIYSPERWDDRIRSEVMVYSCDIKELNGEIYNVSEDGEIEV